MRTRKSLSMLVAVSLLSMGFVACGDDDDKDVKNVSEETSAVLTCPDDNHPHAIDLGLPSGTQWSCSNVGAQKPTDKGNYYAWGEIKTKSDYEDDTYQYYDWDTGVRNIGFDIAGH